jgi:hypothetical protein
MVRCRPGGARRFRQSGLRRCRLLDRHLRSLDPDANLDPGAISTTNCFPKACWKRKGTGFTYRVGDEQPSGPDQITLKTGSAGTAVVQVRGKGGRMFLPVLPLLSTDLTVRARSSSGICWEADYDATGVVTNEPGKFKARSK